MAQSSMKPSETIRRDLRDMAAEVMDLLSETDADSSQELLSGFVSDLYLALAQKRQKENRRRKQTASIAATKAAGIRFGRERLPLPSGFENMARLWSENGISASSAAEKLGMSRDTFLRRAKEYCADSQCHVP